MKSPPMVIVAAVFALSLAFTACRTDNTASTKAVALTRTELFDLRTKCSELARKSEADIKREKISDGSSRSDLDSFTNRYDPETNRCYVERFTTHFQTAKNGEAQVMGYRSVFDAQENVQIVSCDDYVHPSGPRQTKCTDKDAKDIPVSEANSKMNNLMGESVSWP